MTALDAYAYLSRLDERSQAHAPGTPLLQGEVGWRGLGYRVGTHRVVSSYDDIAEILTVPDITPVPGGQPWLLGIANVRGALLPVVDLRQFLGGERTVLHQNQRMLVLRQEGGVVAVLIDALFGQRVFSVNEITDTDVPADQRIADFITRAYRNPDGVWSVFDLSLLLRTPEFRQAAV